MQITKLITAAACFFALGLASEPSDANLIDKATFQKDIAPFLIQRITAFRNDNAATLQPDQNAYLDKILHKIETADRSNLEAVRVEGVDLFGEETARTLLAGKENTLDHPVSKRAAKCSCATDSDWCWNNTKCRSGGCTIQKDQCGTFGTYHCDGRCG